MKVIIPCAGRSSRYPNVPPKWTLPANDGRPMVVHSIDRLHLNPRDVIVTILAEHEERFDATAGIRSALGQEVSITILDKQTRNQPETVAETLRRTGLAEPFLVKDSDNCFALEKIEQPYNYVSAASLNDFDMINPRNKSYLQVDESDVIHTIREKQVISDLFSVGGYYFTDPGQFLVTFDELNSQLNPWNNELYISDIISTLLLAGTPFRAQRVTQYEDWGTMRDWRHALLRDGLYFVLLDGVVMERGSEHFSPRFEDVRPNQPAVEALQKLLARGQRLVFFSIRPQKMAPLTRKQLEALRLPSDTVIYDCPIARYWMVTAADPGLPFLTAEAREVNPTDPGSLERQFAELA